MCGGAYWYFTQGGEESTESSNTEMMEHPVGQAAGSESEQGAMMQDESGQAAGEGLGDVSASTSVDVQTSAQ